MILCQGCWTTFLCCSLYPPSRLHSFHPVLGQHLCSHSSHINPVCWGPSPAPPPLSSPEPPPLHHPVSQLILVSVMGHIWHRSKACSRHIPLRVETTRLFLTVKSQEEWMFACMFLMICLWAYLLAFWAIPPSVPCIPPLSQQPCRLLPGLYFGDIAVVMNHSRRDWRGLPRCSKESNAIYTLHHSHASSHPCPYPSLCSAPHQFVSTDSDWSHHTDVYVCICVVFYRWKVWLGGECDRGGTEPEEPSWAPGKGTQENSRAHVQPYKSHLLWYLPVWLTRKTSEPCVWSDVLAAL